MIFLALLVIHFIIKDRIHSVSVLFYACPLPLIIIFGLFVFLLFYNKKYVNSVLFTLLIGSIIYFGFHYFGAAKEHLPNTTRYHILLWNASRIKPFTQDFLLDHIKQSKPEIIALVEAEDVSYNDLKILEHDFPAYEFRILQGNMLIGVKGTIKNVSFETAPNVCKYNYIMATVHQNPMNILIADVNADPSLIRKIPLDIIQDYVENKHPVDVVLGDFNTPYESAFMKPFKAKYKSFHPYSLGMTSTWPLPFPVIEIDQIWLAQNYNPIKLKKFCSDLSRHKLLIAEYH